MDFNELIKRRYSCRKFKDTPVEPEKLEAILEAARLAPTGGNEQPQRILVVQEKHKRASMDECTRFSFGAPVVLVCCYERGKTAKNLVNGRSCGNEDIAIVMTYLMLACYNEGLANTWVAYLDEEKLREYYHIPTNYEIIGLMPLGYAADDAEPGSRHFTRLPLEATVTYDCYE